MVNLSLILSRVSPTCTVYFIQWVLKTMRLSPAAAVPRSMLTHSTEYFATSAVTTAASVVTMSPVLRAFLALSRPITLSTNFAASFTIKLLAISCTIGLSDKKLVIFPAISSPVLNPLPNPLTHHQLLPQFLFL